MPIAVTIDADAFIESVERLKQTMQRKLENAVRGYTTEIGSILVDNTPYGNPALYMRLYQLRKKFYGFEILPGIAKGSWHLSTGPSPMLLTAPIDYAGPNGDQPKERMRQWAQKYKLGEKVWITNTAPYIRSLNRGQSNQAPDGILTPSLSKIISIYSVSFLEHYKKG